MPKVSDLLTEDLTLIDDLTTIEGLNIELHHKIGTLFALIQKSAIAEQKKTEAIRKSWEAIPESVKELFLKVFGGPENTANLMMAFLFFGSDLMEKVSELVSALKPDKATIERMVNELPPELREKVGEVCQDVQNAEDKKISWH